MILAWILVALLALLVLCMAGVLLLPGLAGGRQSPPPWEPLPGYHWITVADPDCLACRACNCVACRTCGRHAVPFKIMLGGCPMVVVGVDGDRLLVRRREDA